MAFIEPCFGTAHNLSLICQMTSEDIKHQLITFLDVKQHLLLLTAGEWCEKDTDECQLATCSPITDCVDLVNGYRCDPNPEKTAAIVICSILAVILIVVAVFKLKRKNTKIGFE